MRQIFFLLLFFSSISFADVDKVDSSISKINVITISSRTDTSLGLSVLVGNHKKQIMDKKLKRSCSMYNLNCSQSETGEKLVRITLSATGSKENLDMFEKDIKE